MFGATSALISTPCGTPVLGAILALVAEQRYQTPNQAQPSPRLVVPPRGRAEVPNTKHYTLSRDPALSSSYSSCALQALYPKPPAPNRDPILGLFLLLCYSLGQAAPVFAAGLSTSSLKGISKLQPAIAWVTPASGSLLMIYGTYSALERLTALMG